LSKWLASLYTMRRDYWILAILRLGLVSLGFMFAYPFLPDVSRWIILGSVILAAVFGAAFTAVDAALTAIIALHGAILTQRLDRTAGGIGIALRLVTIFIGMVLVAGFTPLYYYGLGSWTFLALPAVLVIIWVILLMFHIVMTLRTTQREFTMLSRR